MMRKSKKNTGKKAITLLAQGVHVKGDIHFQGNLEIEGEVTGNVIGADGSDSEVRVLDSGSVKGELRVPLVFISGTVVGEVFASKQVELAASARVDGNIHYTLLEVERGAQVNGNFVLEKPETAKNVVLPMDEAMGESIGDKRAEPQS